MHSTTFPIFVGFVMKILLIIFFKDVFSNKSKSRMRRRRTQRGGNTNGYSIGGVHLKPSLSGIANNYHTPFDSCKG